MKARVLNCAVSELLFVRMEVRTHLFIRMKGRTFDPVLGSENCHRLSGYVIRGVGNP
jgi:hypothetical protein